MARAKRIRKPRSVDPASWRALRRQTRANVAAFNKRARALIRNTERRLREQARELAKQRRADERARLNDIRATLRFLRKSKLFEPPKSAFRVIPTKRGPRRLPKTSYLLRSPKLKTAISAHRATDPRMAFRERLLGIFPNAREYRGAFDDIMFADPAYIAQLNTLSDQDLQIVIRVRNEDYNDVLAELLGEEPVESHSSHPLYYHGKRTITGVAV